MAETMPRKFTVCAAFYDSDCRATITVEAEDFADACEKAISAIDSGEIDTDRKTWDPTSTFVYGVVEGDGDPWDGTQNVPFRFSEDSIHLPQHHSDAITLAEQVARLETWGDCITHICKDEGVTDPMAIKARIQEEQFDLDYLVGQHQALNGLIEQAREIVRGEAIEPAPAATTVLTTCLGALDACLTQIGQMRGMFDDSDGAIQDTVDAAEEAIEQAKLISLPQ
jgi:hypothetical protein